jgi:DNA-binding NarL/FixJ family response regulator
MGIGFSKPARPAKTYARLGNLTTIPGGIDGAGLPMTTESATEASRPKVLITDDQSVLLAGLARLRAPDTRLTLVDPADEGLETVERTLRLTPDLVLLDLQPVGASTINGNGSTSESTSFKVVVLAADFDHQTVPGIEKNGSSSHFGDGLIPDGVVSRILALYASREPAAPARKAEISKRELSVLSHVAAGQSNKQIGNLLGISQKTVRNHLTRIFHKLRASNRTEAVMNAMRLGLLTV